MTLRPGCQLLAAPAFPPVADWADRLRLSAGVTISGSAALPRGPWREPTPDELALLVRDPALPLYQADLDAAVALWPLTHRLLTLGWQSLEATLATGPGPEFAAFLREVCDFLAFKNLLPPGGLSAEVVAVPPGRPSLGTDPATGGPAGLGWTEGLWGVVHLGDAPAELVFVNAPVDLDAEPDYPVVALTLRPGDGVRLPRTSILFDAPTGDDPGLWLLLHPAAEAPP